MRRTRLRPVSVKRARARASWEEQKRRVWARSQGWCEAPRCCRRAVDVHHLVKRSQGGTNDLTNLAALCRPCHDATDLAYDRGRLLLVAP